MATLKPDTTSPREASRAFRTLLLSVAVATIALAGTAPVARTAPWEPVHDAALNLIRFQREVPPLLPTTGDSPSGAPGRAAVPVCTWSLLPNTRTHPTEGGQHIWPDIAVGPGGLLGAAWMDDHAAGGYHIFYSASTDGGASWSTPEQVDTRIPGGYSKFVDLDFTPSGIPVAVWEDERFGSINVFLSRRDPSAGGTPWTPNVQVNTAGSPPNGTYFMNPSLTVLDEDRYFVAWSDWRESVFFQVYGRGSWDGGLTWGTESRVSDGLGFEPVAGEPCLIVDPNSSPVPGEETLYCLTNDWRGDVGLRYPNVYFYRSADAGATWSIGVLVNDIEPNFQQGSSHALVRLDDGTLTAAWFNSVTGPSDVRTSVSTDDGATWGTSVPASTPGTAAPQPCIVSAGGSTVFAAFSLFEVDWNAYFRVSSEGGRTWILPPCRLDDDLDGNQQQVPVVAALSPTAVAGVWQDSRPGGPWQVYSTSGGPIALGSEVVPSSSRTSVVRIESVAPNPAAGPAHVVFETPRRGPVLARILDVAGRSVRVLLDADLPAGRHAMAWDGRDAGGERMASGAYWVEVAANGQRAAAKLLIVK